MNRPPGINGVAFTEGGDGDQRNDLAARSAVSARLDISSHWATVRQVHGTSVMMASGPGKLGKADGIWTDLPGLPLAVFTADCFGVVLVAERAVGVAHTGWRGAAGGVVTALREEMARHGHEPLRAALGPGIGSCCFEVGPEVARRFPHAVAETSWGITSVDVAASIGRELEDLDPWAAEECTMHDPGMFSHRRDQTMRRMATIGWVP